jgi:hypothetical protein
MYYSSMFKDLFLIHFRTQPSKQYAETIILSYLLLKEIHLNYYFLLYLPIIKLTDLQPIYFYNVIHYF